MSLKVYNTQVAFSEIPDEITLCVNISNCPNRCPLCHSPWLQEDVGEMLTESRLDELIKGCGCPLTCVCFMGGDQEPQRVIDLCRYVQTRHQLLSAWYSGRPYLLPAACDGSVDYYKFGPYNEKYGPLNSTTTNQVMLRYSHGRDVMENITKTFLN